MSNWSSILAKVRAALVRKGRSEEDADDLVQDAFVRLAQFSRKQTVEQPEAFMMKVAMNLSVDAHRALMVRGEVLEPEEVVIVDGRPSTEDVVLARERLAHLVICLSRMSEKTRAIFLANKVDGMSYMEIAERYGITRSAVEKHIAKGVMLTVTWMEDL